MQSGDFVTLALDTEVFAIPVAYVREILDYCAPFKIPEAPDYLVGLVDVRGRGTPILDLRLRLDLPSVPPDGATRILVLDVPVGNRVLGLGLVADRVIEVASFTQAETDAAPDIGVHWRSDYITGIVRREGGFIVLLNMPRLLTSAERVLADAAQLNAA